MEMVLNKDYLKETKVGIAFKKNWMRNLYPPNVWSLPLEVG